MADFTITEEQAENIAELASDYLGDECEARSYSGRGMYGKSCLGFTVGGNSVRAAAAITMAMQQLEDELDLEVERVIRSINSDSMGRGTIIYFSQVELSEEEEV